MASNTPRFNLLKKDPLVDKNDTFNIKTMMNDNWDKLDGAAKKEELDSHVNNPTKHITDEERESWNAKETKLGSQEKADAAKAEAKAYTDTAPEAMLQNMGRFETSRSAKDANGNFLTVEKKRKDGTLFEKAVLSDPNAEGNPTVRTITTYAADGITVVGAPVVFDIQYDADGDYIKEVPR